MSSLIWLCAARNSAQRKPLAMIVQRGLRSHKPLLKFIFCAAGLGLVAGVACYFWPDRETPEWQQQEPDNSDALASGDVGPVPPFPPGPFLNTGSDAELTGSDRCIECHQAAAAAYRRTGMGQSLARLDPAIEPPDAVFDHLVSGRRYQVYRRDGELRHREILLSGSVESSAEPVVLADYDVDWVIGSGRHSRSYLLEIDGFLVESPMTWYSKRQEWDMSPGYDAPNQGGFSRPVDEGCLFCHAGRVEAVAGSTHRIKVHESWISCERCHGPGSLHVARHTSGTTQPDPVNPGERHGSDSDRYDATIVNQSHLDRNLSESICAQCHLRSSATVSGRDRSLRDFRPGLPLNLFRADYRLASGKNQMTVVGHVDQLRQSVCWQKSALTCTTCHNPHAFPEEQNRVAYYRAICQNCHSDDSCSVGSGIRETRSPDNNCVTCHMPGSGTEIPHLSFTHHRIGVHDKDLPEPQPDDTDPGKLVAIDDLTPWSALDRERMLGMAWLEVANSKRGKYAEVRRQRALQLLNKAWDRGLHDSATASALVALTSRTGDPRVRVFADAILKDSGCAPKIQINALLARALAHADASEPDAAVRLMEEIVKRRRVSGDWVLLGEFQNMLKKEDASIRSLERVLEIETVNPQLRSWLIDYYQRQGKTERAEWHQHRQPAASQTNKGVKQRGRG